MAFQDFEPMFGEPKAEWSAPNKVSLPPFLFYVHPSDSSRLRVLVTDFCSNTWEAIRSVQDLEDMRDNIGIGGSWSDFLAYVIDSLKSGEVKLVLEGDSKSDGAAYAKLSAQKSKGMPLISISLGKLVDVAASEAIKNLSLELYKAFKSMHSLLINEQERCYQLTEVISSEQEKNESIQRQLDTFIYSKRQKSQKMNDKAFSDTLLVTSLEDSPDKTATQGIGSTKVNKRVVPAYRRAKVRGVLLQDTEDDADN
ncbi:uncharacterized protein LOC132267337 [Cornus florida]|uniref:uncharacterized protein LOC132267337 n=1 Tax=Cornus florida TaxID=4283 RepID=UPI00289641D7|nr:uncharacterized protein LOC132267337 [Cornus florida]